MQRCSPFLFGVCRGRTYSRCLSLKIRIFDVVAIGCGLLHFEYESADVYSPVSVIFQVVQVKSMEQWTARVPLPSGRMR